MFIGLADPVRWNAETTCAMTWENSRFPSGEDAQYALDPVLLRFRQRETEINFVNETLANSINFVRIYLAAGTGLYGLFGILDATVGGDKVQALWTIRYLFVLPILTGVIVTTFFPIFRRFPQTFLGITMLTAGTGIIAMTIVMDPPFNSHYYAGLVMVVIYCSALINLKYCYSLYIALGLVAAYQVPALWLNPLTHDQYISNNLFLIAATGVGMYSTYFQELYLRRAYISTSIIAARNKLTSKLLEEARIAHAKKRDFLAMISHELRTPLNAVIGFADILNKQMFGKMENPRYREYAGDIYNSGRHLLTIIDEILDVATFDETEMTIEVRNTDLADVASTCVRMMETVAMNKNISVTCAGLDRSVKLIADEKRLRQLLLNLISNALKFTPNGGRVHIALRLTERNGISLSVTDSGVGIAPNDIERAMRPFEQVENALSRNMRGTGLGLAISEAIVKLHGGRLEIDSKLGVGTTVTVQLPSTCLLAADPGMPLKLAG